MRAIVLGMFGFLVSCGHSSDSAAKDPEVTALSLSGQPQCFNGSCDVDLDVSCTTSGDDLCPPAGFKYVAAVLEGETPPAHCDGASVGAFYKTAHFTMLKPSTKYAFRGCLLNEAKGSYSSGATLGIQIP